MQLLSDVAVGEASKHVLQSRRTRVISVLSFCTLLKTSCTGCKAQKSGISGVKADRLLSLQFVREFAKLGLTRSVGGVLALALSRELTPVVTCIILAGVSQLPQNSCKCLFACIRNFLVLVLSATAATMLC